MEGSLSSSEGEGSSSWDANRRFERLIQFVVEMVSFFYQMVGMEGS